LPWKFYIFSHYLKGTAIKPDEYRTVETSITAKLRVKKSLFIGTIAPASDKTSAEEFIQQIRRQYHDAAHHCFAFRVDESVFRTSDDGEPVGTAGKPILSMLDKHQLFKVILVVTRYFGGIKLGTGGLIRAYSDCAEEVIGRATICQHYNFEKVVIHFPFELINKVRKTVHRFRGKIKEDADTSGMQAEIEILPSKMELFRQELLTATSGKINFISE
jgi:uncharacterized YigZ family protein